MAQQAATATGVSTGAPKPTPAAMPPATTVTKRPVVIRGELARPLNSLPSNWPPLPPGLGANFLLPPKDCCWVLPHVGQRYHINPARYGSTGYFSLCICKRAYHDFELCDTRGCLGRHGPLHPDHIRWMAQGGEEDFFTNYMSQYFPKEYPTTLNNARSDRNYRDVKKRDIKKPPALDTANLSYLVTGTKTDAPRAYPHVESWLNSMNVQLEKVDWLAFEDIWIRYWTAHGDVAKAHSLEGQWKTYE